jgi:hypothetical protein
VSSLRPQSVRPRRAASEPVSVWLGRPGWSLSAAAAAHGGVRSDLESLVAAPGKVGAAPKATALGPPFSGDALHHLDAAARTGRRSVIAINRGLQQLLSRRRRQLTYCADELLAIDEVDVLVARPLFRLSREVARGEKRPIRDYVGRHDTKQLAHRLDPTL